MHWGELRLNGTKLQACVNDQAHFSVYGIAESGVNSFDISLTMHAQVQGVYGQGCWMRVSFPQVCRADSASISLPNTALSRHCPSRGFPFAPCSPKESPKRAYFK